MTIGSFFKAKRVWATGEFPPPWGEEKQSLYGFIGACVDEDEALPDENDDENIKFAAGALDGIFSHHVGKGEPDDAAQQIISALKRVLNRPNESAVRSFYELAIDVSAKSVVDDLLSDTRWAQLLNTEHMRIFFLWLAQNAPDREPVKLAIAMLGMFQGRAQRDLFLTLGRHSEFTLFSAVALRNSQENLSLIHI